MAARIRIGVGVHLLIFRARSPNNKKLWDQGPPRDNQHTAQERVQKPEWCRTSIRSHRRSSIWTPGKKIHRVQRGMLPKRLRHTHTYRFQYHEHAYPKRQLWVHETDLKTSSSRISCKRASRTRVRIELVLKNNQNQDWEAISRLWAIIAALNLLKY